MTRIVTRCRAVLLAAVACSATAQAGPFIDPGDMALRHDIQRLADRNLIKGPVTTWPLAWGPILEDLQDADVSALPTPLADSVMRVRYRGQVETQTDTLGFQAQLGVASDPTKIRSFQDTPRGDAEVSAGVEWLGNWLSAEINLQYVDGDPEVDEFRADGSMVGIAAGNWSISVNTLERWWGPGWDGSLILSNNARPIPSLTVDRIFTDPFKSKWLRWLGPWDLSLTFGQLESDRVVSNAQFFGMRFNFRPLDSLEIGLTRAAQWCGDGRPCDAETFVNLLVGKDNRGGQGIGINNEPGNQLAGIDFRWSPILFGQEIAFYGQLIGEDEAGGFPSRYMGQFGGEWSGYVADRWSARIFGEFAGTSCQFHESSELFNCAYNHSIYQTGYRYRGRAIGHGADNDARIASAGLILVDSAHTEWRALLRVGKLNRGGPPDPRNTLSPTPADIQSIDIAHARELAIGAIEVGLGHESFDDIATGDTRSDTRFHLQWRHLF